MSFEKTSHYRKSSVVDPPHLHGLKEAFYLPAVEMLHCDSSLDGVNLNTSSVKLSFQNAAFKQPPSKWSSLNSGQPLLRATRMGQLEFTSSGPVKLASLALI